jgi:hypothetical protein
MDPLVSGWAARREQRRIDEAARVLEYLRARPDGDYGFPMSRRLGLRSSRLYPALYALERDGLIVGVFDTGRGLRRRRYFAAEHLS